MVRDRNPKTKKKKLVLDGRFGLSGLEAYYRVQ